MRTYFFLPPLGKPSGGMAVMAQLASHLREAGYQIFFAADGAFPQGVGIDPDIPVIPLNDIRLCETDRWIIPEGWPALLAPGLRANAACAVYVQNWAFLHGILPENVEWQNLKLRMFSVSHPVSLFIEETTGFHAPIVRPAIDPRIFFPGQDIRKPSAKGLRIAWMPRKNRHLATQIRRIFEAVVRRARQPAPTWIPIENVPLARVAELLRTADIFLSTGFPEGFGLPPLEAMACGCLVAGFSGMGGWDYMRQALPGGFSPCFDLPDVPWGANGFFAADGDAWGGAMALKAAYDRLTEGSASGVMAAGSRAAAWYSPERQREELLRLWEDEHYWN